MRRYSDDERSEFAHEAGEARLARQLRCRCGPTSESPCSGCELRAEMAEREAEAAAESEAHARLAAEDALGSPDVERCEDCGEFRLSVDLLHGLCAPCSKDRDDRRQSAEEYAAREPKTLQEQLGLDDGDLPF